MGNLIERLEQEKEQLQQQLKETQVEKPAQNTPLTSSHDAIHPWKTQVDSLQNDYTIICQEREQLWEQVKQLQTQNSKLLKDHMRSEATIKGLMERVERINGNVELPP